VPLLRVIVRFLGSRVIVRLWTARNGLRLLTRKTCSRTTYDIEICVPDGRRRLGMPDAAFGITAASVTAGTIPKHAGCL